MTHFVIVMNAYKRTFLKIFYYIKYALFQRKSHEIKTSKIVIIPRKITSCLEIQTKHMI